MANKILYTDKETVQVSALPEIQKATAANYNSIKDVVNVNADELIARPGNVQNSDNTFDVDTGAADAYDITLSPAITAYAKGQLFSFEAINANLTTTPTVDVNGVGAQTIINRDGSALSPGDIPANSLSIIQYDGTNFRLLTTLPGGASAGVNNQIQIGDGANGFKVDDFLHFIATGANGIGIGNVDTDASGINSTAIGQDANAEDTESIAIGKNAYASALNAMVIGNDTKNTTPKSFGVNFQASSPPGAGPEPHFKIVWDSTNTTDATPKAGLIFTLLDETVYFLTARVVARDSAGTSVERAAYTIEGIVYREGAGSAIQQGATSVLTSIETSAGLNADFNVSGNNVEVEITGLAATNIDWDIMLQVHYVD